MNYTEKVINRLNELIPNADSLIDLYALLVLVKGEDTTLEDVHDAWAVWKNRINPKHESLIIFDELALEVQELDRKYMNAIHQVAREVL